MKREELIKWLDDEIIHSAELCEDGDAKSWGYEEGILISRNEAEEIREFLSLPPAEGVELDHSHDHLLDHPEGAEEILEDIAMRIDASGVGNNRDAIKRFYRDKLNTLATLHAQRIADKMVSNESAGAILLKFQSFVHNHMNGFVFDAWIIEYLKTRER